MRIFLAQPYVRSQLHGNDDDNDRSGATTRMGVVVIKARLCCGGAQQRPGLGKTMHKSKTDVRGEVLSFLRVVRGGGRRVGGVVAASFSDGSFA